MSNGDIQFEFLRQSNARSTNTVAQPGAGPPYFLGYFERRKVGENTDAIPVARHRRERAVELSFQNSTILWANCAGPVPMDGLAISDHEWSATLSVGMTVLIEPVGLFVREQPEV